MARIKGGRAKRCAGTARRNNVRLSIWSNRRTYAAAAVVLLVFGCALATAGRPANEPAVEAAECAAVQTQSETPSLAMGGEDALSGSDVYDGELAVPSYVRLDRLSITGASMAYPLESAVVTSRFGYRQNPVTGKYTFHTGYDLAAPAGSEIKAMLSGSVSTARFENGYGNYIILDHEDGLQTLYAHCSKLLVGAGDKVQAGQSIALVGSTGNSTGAHLHVEFRRDGQRYDPEWLLGGVYS